jgi:hypothetical protein
MRAGKHGSTRGSATTVIGHHCQPATSPAMSAGQGALGRSSRQLWAEEGLPGFGAREMVRRQDAMNRLAA